MKKRKVSAVILAAGKGVRMKSKRPKVLTTLCGKTLLDTVTDNLIKLGVFEEIVVVLNKDLIYLSAGLKAKSKRLKIATQRQPLGTADAIKAAMTKLSKKATDIFIIGADIVLFKPDSIMKLLRCHLDSQRAVNLISAFSDAPEGYGRIIRGKRGGIERVTEEIDLSDSEKQIGEINSGIYCFKHDALTRALKAIKRNSKKKEYYLTDAIALLADQGIGAVAAESAEEIIGINSVFDLVRAQKVMSTRIIAEFLSKGVKILDPQTTYVQTDVDIGSDTVIHPFTFIESNVKIGKDCSIGPFARIRGGVHLDDNVTVGNFVELSRTRAGSGTIIKHFSYLGDCLIGKEVNVGAGSVTANYDGKVKHKTRIEDGAFIGCDTVLVAPVKVGKRAITGAGSVVLKNSNIPKGKVAVGVPARIIKGSKNE